jgi:hypothetical protein
VLLEDHSVSDAARIAARVTGKTKKGLYARALELGAQGAVKARKPR